MRKIIALVGLMALLVGAMAALSTSAVARGGTSLDDCTPGSNDPDCK